MVELKRRGNDALTAGHAAEALAVYSTAIATARTEVRRKTRESPTNAHGIAVLHCNRALAWLRLSGRGNASDAALDCAMAIDASPGFLKAHVRLAKVGLCFTVPACATFFDAYFLAGWNNPSIYRLFMYAATASPPLIVS